MCLSSSQSEVLLYFLRWDCQGTESQAGKARRQDQSGSPQRRQAHPPSVGATSCSWAAALEELGSLNATHNFSTCMGRRAVLSPRFSDTLPHPRSARALQSGCEQKAEGARAPSSVPVYMTQQPGGWASGSGGWWCRFLGSLPQMPVRGSNECYV